MAEQPVPTTISRSEAATLRRIVRDRFKLLRAQLPIRERELRARMEAEAMAEHDEIAAEANAEGQELIEEQRDLEARIDDFRVRCAAKGLVQPRYSSSLASWRSPKTDREFARRVDELGTERRRAEMGLTERELGLLELLALPMIQSSEAMDFLARIPSIEKVLTGGEEAAQLGAGS